MGGAMGIPLYSKEYPYFFYKNKYMYISIYIVKVQKPSRPSTIPWSHQKLHPSPVSTLPFGKSASSLHDTAPQPVSCGTLTQKSEAAVTVQPAPLPAPPQPRCPLDSPSLLQSATNVQQRWMALKSLAVTAVYSSQHGSTPLPQRLGTAS